MTHEFIMLINVLMARINYLFYLRVKSLLIVIGNIMISHFFIINFLNGMNAYFNNIKPNNR